MSQKKYVILALIWMKIIIFADEKCDNATKKYITWSLKEIDT